MSRFVIVSIVGLGFAFYELSGGAEFEPQTRTQPERTAATQAQPLNTAAAARVAQNTVSQVQTPVLTAAVSLAAAAPVPPTRSRNTADIAPAALDQADLTKALTQALQTEALQLASLQGGLASVIAEPANDAVETAALQAPTVEELPPADIRSVRASRVNMRQGPNTSYPILTRLLAGDRVEIMRDEGAGWALLRVEKTGQVGWIATSLLSPKGS